MKMLLLLSLLVTGLGILAPSVQAGDASPILSVQFKDGKVLAFRDAGKGQPVTNEFTFAEGVKVMTNGTFTVGNGKPRKFQEGQILGTDGNLTSLDGTVEPVADHVVMKGIKLTLVLNGERTIASREVVLGDGSRVQPDGTLVAADRSLHRMLDGQILKFSGESIASVDTVMVKDGLAVLQKDGARVILKRGQTIAMSDGSKVFADGTIKRRDGTVMKVSEGEIYKIPGILPAKQ